MKKLFSLFSILLLCVMGFGLTACGNEADEQVLKPTDIGYEVPIYPACNFYFKVDDSCTFYITDMSITLTKINEINNDEILTDYFYRYNYTIRATATTDPSNYGNSYEISFSISGNSISAGGTVSADGAIYWEEEINARTEITNTSFSIVRVRD